MELKEFVRSTLLEIVAGVTDAQKALDEEGSTAVVNAGASGDKRYTNTAARVCSRWSSSTLR